MTDAQPPAPAPSGSGEEPAWLQHRRDMHAKTLVDGSVPEMDDVLFYIDALRERAEKAEAEVRVLRSMNSAALRVITREYCDERGEPKQLLPDVIERVSDALLGLESLDTADGERA